MNDLFQIPTGNGSRKVENPFRRFDLAENPFPPAGVDSGVLYQGHMRNELEQVNSWIQDVGSATDPGRALASAVRPLAIFGTVGVGKTHLLRYLERGLSANSATPVLRKGLADEGMTRLALANLFLRYLPFQDEGEEPGTGLIRRLVEIAKDQYGDGSSLFDVLRAGSPIEIPFKELLKRDLGDDAVVWMSRWLRREYTTPSQRAKLGIGGVLKSEGEAVRAVADLLRLARAAKLLQVWFVMVDQLEELWRPGVISASRRARFLTDLRHLVDQALEGSPIAVLLAWNTTVAHDVFGGDVSNQLKRDYVALWQRLGRPIDLPPLSRADVWPFAEEYLMAAGVTQRSSERRRELFFRLKQATEQVVTQMEQEGVRGSSSFTPRLVLGAWREMARKIAEREDLTP